MVIRNPLRRRYLVQKYLPVRSAGPVRVIQESPPAPAFRRYWRLETAKRIAFRLNQGMTAIQAKERFRVIQRP